MRCLAHRREDKIVATTGDYIAEHFGKPIKGRADRWGARESISLNVLYTNPEATAIAPANCRITVSRSSSDYPRASYSVQFHIASRSTILSYPLHFLARLLREIVERFGSAARQYVLHIYVCRSRIDTLLRVLRPSSLVVIGGRRRIWPTAETRLSKAVAAAGHSVAFVDLKACQAEAR